MPGGGLAGKTALVTGAGQRIGRAISLALAAEGANVVAHYARGKANVITLCAELDRWGVKSWAVAADFARSSETESLIARAREAAGTLDILINNASIFRPGTLANMDFAELMTHMQVNAWAPFVLGREFARQAAAGTIVNLLDTRITDGDPAHVPYLLSKQALAELTRMMALEFAPAVAVNAVAPGLILPPPGKDETYLQQLADTVPLRRHGGPEDIAAAVLYLVQTRFVTGQVLFVDGGRHIKEYPHGSHPYP